MSCETLRLGTSRRSRMACSSTSGAMVSSDGCRPLPLGCKPPKPSVRYAARYRRSVRSLIPVCSQIRALISLALATSRPSASSGESSWTRSEAILSAFFQSFIPIASSLGRLPDESTAGAGRTRRQNGYVPTNADSRPAGQFVPASRGFGPQAVRFSGVQTAKGRTALLQGLGESEGRWSAKRPAGRDSAHETKFSTAAASRRPLQWLGAIPAPPRLLRYRTTRTVCTARCNPEAHDESSGNPCSASDG